MGVKSFSSETSTQESESPQADSTPHQAGQLTDSVNSPQNAPVDPEQPLTDLLEQARRLRLGLDGARNPAKAVTLLETAVRQRNPKAMLALAEIYRTGDGAPAAPEKAEALYKQALGAGDLAVARRAAYGLGDLHRRLPIHNPQQAARTYRQAADAGHPWATYALARLLLEGSDGVPNQAEAERLLLRAIEAGDAGVEKDAAHALGELYRDGALRSPEKALRYHSRAADAGHAWSMLALAEIYRDGNGVTADPVRTRDYYRMAADAGNSKAADIAARALALSTPEQTRPEPLDSDSAAAQGSEPAPAVVSAAITDAAPPSELTEPTKHKSADAAKPDRSGASKSASVETPESTPAQAVDLGPLSALIPAPVPRPRVQRAVAARAISNAEKIWIWETFTRAERYRKGEGVTADLEQAAALYKKLVGGKDRKASRAAAYRLGELYKKGPLRDLASAAEYYRRAAEQGSPWAMYTLAEFYRSGRGVNEDRKLARTFYLKAMKAGDPRAARAARRALRSIE